MDRRTAIASALAASTIAVGPRLFAAEDVSATGMANAEPGAPALANSAARPFIGRWRISGEKESLEMTLEPTGKFMMKCFALPSVDAGKGEFKWGGKGDWDVRDGLFLLHKTHKWMWVGWGEDADTIYSWRQVVDVTPSAIVLTGRVELVRL